MENKPIIANIKTDKLIPYARNSRTHSPEQVSQIAASIKEFGFLNPIITDGRNGIIAGHGRVMAAQKLGIKELPCIEASHLTDAQRRAYVIADNKLALNSDWDNDLLKIELDDLRSSGFNIDLTGFSLDEIEELKDDSVDPLDGEDDEPEQIDDKDYNPISKNGDVWIIGEHRLVCGDSTNKNDVDALMNGELADMVWTDPPYNVNYEGSTSEKLKIKNDNMSDSNFAAFLRDAYESYIRIMQPGAVIYVAHADIERVNFTSEFNNAGFKFAQNLTWVKSQSAFGRSDFNWQHEPIIYGWKPGAAHYFCGNFKLTSVIDDANDVEKMSKAQAVEALRKIYEGEISTVIRHEKPKKSELHPTMKPVSLVERMITWSSKRNWNVVDLFGGSGTTLIAAHKQGRKAFLMELDPVYCDAIIIRFKKLFDIEAINEKTGKRFSEV